MKLSNLIVFSDLNRMPREALEEINTDLGLPDATSQQEMVKSIGIELNQNSDVREKLANYYDTLFVGGSVSWYKMEKGSIGELRSIIESRTTNPFKEKVVLESGVITADPIIYGAADFPDNPEDFYIRYVYNSGNTLIPTSDGDFKTVERATFVTALVIPSLNVVEIRAPRSIANKIAKKIGSAFPDKDGIILKKVLIFDDDLGTDTKVQSFINKTDARVSESVDFPVLESVEDSFDDQAILDLHNILETIDNRGNDDDSGLLTDINQAVDNSTILEKFNHMPFVAILLNGLGKVNLSSLLTDLRNTPLYELLHPYLQTKFSFVEINFPADGVDQIYSVQLGKTTNSVSFTKQANENFLRHVRNSLLV